MIGGPTGFAGAERYQYGPDTPEGRAIEAAKALKAAGKAPAKIVLGLSDGSIGQLTQPFPAGAPSIKDLWEKETGITLEIVGLPNGQEFTKTMQDISTKGGGYDIYAVEWNRLGDLAESGGIVKLDDYRRHAQAGMGRSRARLCQRRARACRCSTSIAARPMACRSTATSRPGSTAPTCSATRPRRRPSRTSTATTSPRRGPGSSSTRSRAFFHRPDKGLFGSTDLRNQGWGYTNWYQRYRLDGARPTSSCSTMTARR